MTKVGRFAKYQFLCHTKAVLIFYALIFMFAILTNSPGSGNTLAGSGIFVFVLGLNWFKTSFRFSQANNLPRKVFYVGTILAILALTLVMCTVDTILAGVFQGVTIGLYRQIYPPQILAEFLWRWSALAVSASFGLMVSMVYYRSTPLLKILVSLSPVFVFWLLNQIDKRTGGEFWYRFFTFLMRAFGRTGEIASPYPAVLSFVVLALAIWAASAALMYRVPIKN